jgi:hypothetical protein
MSYAHLHNPQHPHDPHNDPPADFEPGTLPVEPDQGPVPALIPGDHEHERTIDPAANQAGLAHRSGRHVELAFL